MRWKLAPLYLALALLVAGLALVAHATRRPDAAWLETAARLPVVGPLAAHFRAAYLPPARQEPPGEPPAPVEVIVVVRGATGEPVASALAGDAPSERELATLATPEELGARPSDWLLAGSVLREEPAADSAEVLRVDAHVNVSLLPERSGSWVRVRHRSRVGWVPADRLAGRGHSRPDAPPPLGSAPEPVVPVEGRPPDPERLARARALLGIAEDAEPGRLGAYPLLTDVTDRVTLARLERLVESLEPAYRERFGVFPQGEPRAAVVLFAEEAAYRRYLSAEPRLATLGGRGHAGHGLAVTHADGQSPGELAETLVHELVHLVNRRAVGPALPPWLDEGLADELALSALDPRGRLLPGTRGGTETIAGTRVTLTGGRALAPFVADALPRAPSLPELLALDWDAFVAPGSSRLHYAQSALLVRFLLDGEGGRHAEAFRGYLAGIARGEPADPEALRERLGLSWDDLERRFETWVLFQATVPRVAAESRYTPSR